MKKTYAIPIEVSPGELIDKLTILEIKQTEISDPEKLRNIAGESKSLLQSFERHIKKSEALDQLMAELKAINRLLWQIEDEIRQCEEVCSFDDHFIALARSVYQNNDQRAAVKKEINVLLGAKFGEEKSYAG